MTPQPLSAGADALEIARHDLECAAQSYEREAAIAANLRHQLDGYVRRALTAGLSEVEVARRSGLSRPTVRKIAGKLPPADRDALVDVDPDQLAIDL